MAHKLTPPPLPLHAKDMTILTTTVQKGVRSPELSGAPNENTVQDHLNIALLNVF